MSKPQALLSYRTKRAAEVAPLLTALADAGVRVWRDEARIDEGASITEGVFSGIAESQVLLAWYSEDYPRTGSASGSRRWRGSRRRPAAHRTSGSFSCG